MSVVRDLVTRVRETGDFSALTDQIAYTKFMGLSASLDGELVIGKLSYSHHLVGNAMLPALHGGTLCALLEHTAICQVMWSAPVVRIPKSVNITIEYLRSAAARDTFARGTITKHGRRVAVVRAEAWQDDPQRPVAAAHCHFLLDPEPAP